MVLHSNIEEVVALSSFDVIYFSVVNKLSNFDEFVECLDSLMQEGCRLNPCLE